MVAFHTYVSLLEGHLEDISYSGLHQGIRVGR